MALQTSKSSFLNINLTQWFYILYYGVIATALAYFLWFRGLQKTKANIAGAFMGIMPVSSTVLCIIILKESLTIKTGLGLFFISIGILITTKQNGKFFKS